jgi:hypothetical protein
MRLDFIFLEIFTLYLQINQIKFQEIELNFIFSRSELPFKRTANLTS